MRALTLTQPYATLIAIGAKRVETRSWGTTQSGPLAIHAATYKKNSDIHEAVFRPAIYRALSTSANGGLPAIPSGSIVAVCHLVACLKIIDPPPEPEHSFGDYTPGRYAWILSNVHPLREPIPIKGHLGLWNWDAPANLEELLLEAK